ncbi:hypothetical protein [Pararhodonellum marinum]|uniref:hypothetical protein n=1 Tax=Pararhodonellum marinum TaxID=2755358 RepID=UPI00188EE3E2|nr:hypothetical protein [Pararhodonellum marinum]
MRSLIKILILIITLGISDYTFAKVETDTITTWRMTKDSELLIESNHFNSKIYAVELNIVEKYEYLNISVFYDFNSDTINRKIKFIDDKKTIAEFEDDNNSRLPFKLPKKEIDKISSGVLNKPIAIVYNDSISENGILIGFVIFTKEQ